MYGSDQAASLEEAGLRYVVGTARIAERACGDGKKVFTQEEKKIAEKLRSHISKT